MKATIDWLETKVWFRVVLLIISYLLLPIIYFSTAIPLLLYRLLAVGTAAWFRPGFVALSPESGLTTVDNFYTDGEVEHAVVGCHYTDKVIQRKDVVERMQEVINSRRFPELQKSLHRWMGLWFWGGCPTFKLESHIRSRPDVKTLEEVQLAQDGLCRVAFLTNAPLWDITLFPNYVDDEGGSAFCLRVHHALTDGVGHVALLNAIGGIEPPPQQPPPNFSEVAISWLKYFVDLIRIFTLHQYALSIAFLQDYNFNAWIKPPQLRSRKVHFYESHTLELATLKKASKATGHTASEVLMCAFATAIRQDMEGAGDPVPLAMSAIHPLAKPGHPGTLTNHAYMNTLALPVGVKDRKAQLAQLAGDYKLKRCTALLVNLSVTLFGIFLQLSQYLPKVGPYTTLAVTNFALSSKPWHFFGAEIKRTSFVFDMSEHVPLVAMFIGYREKMFIWVKCREDVMRTQERPKKMVEAIVREVHDMARVS